MSAWRERVLASTGLRNTQAGHSKFYSVVVVEQIVETGPSGGFLVRFRWGRIGTSGQIATKSFIVARAAVKFAQEKIEEKLGSGYVAVVVSGSGEGTMSVSELYDRVVTRGQDPAFIVAAPSEVPQGVVAPQPGGPFAEADDSFFGKLREEIDHGNPPAATGEGENGHAPE